MSSNMNNNTMLNDKLNHLGIKEPTRKSESVLEIENAYLTQQNQHLSRELSFARYTITALKNMTYQKECHLDETRQELERALQHIQLLQLRSRPTLIQDDLSDDQSEEEYEHIQQQQQQRRQSEDIMSKLPLRHPIINVQQLDYSC